MSLYDNIRGIAGAGVAQLNDWMARSDDDVSFGDMNEAMVKAGIAEPTEEKPRALFHDPYSVMDWGGWRQRPSALTYDTLRQMTHSNTVIGAIIQLRIDQIAQFAVPQQGKYDKGYRVILRDRRDNSRAMSTAEKAKATEIERMIESTGYLLPEERHYDRDSFRHFLKKSIRDAMTYDQMCHPAGTFIQMASGSLLPIEDVKVGDFVMTHRGRARRVTDIKARSYTGQLHQFRYGGQTLEATGGHPLLAEQGPHMTVRRAWKEPNYNREWVAAKDISEGQYLVFPDVQLPEGVAEGPWGLITTEDARVLGLYVANGHSQKGRSTWTFHEDNEGYVEAVEQFAQSHGYESVRIEYRDRRAIGVAIRAGTHHLGHWLDETCGKGAEYKRVPSFVLTATLEIKRAFLRGYLEGDGHLKASSAILGTVSLDLRGTLTLLAASLGMRISWSVGGNEQYGWNRNYVGSVSGASYRDFAIKSGLGCTQPSRPREPHVYADGYHYIRIREKSRRDVIDLLVFNFEVEEDHSYIANDVVSHNCFEKLRDRTGKPSRFICLPAETIRPAVADVEHMDPEEKRNRVAYVQVYEETVIAEFGPDDIAWCIKNPRSDLRVNGFGFSPVEMITRLVTAWLYGFEYNSRFFCVVPSTYVTTDRGMCQVGELVGEQFQIWNGYDWRDATAYETGRKPVVRTILWNGLEIETSPKHLFRVIPRESDSGEPEWREQRALKSGDTVLVSYRREDSPWDMERFSVGKTYATDRSTGRDFTPTKEMLVDPEFWEMVGFALGDGYFPELGSRKANFLRIFPHHTKDAFLFDRFLAVCERYGINAKRKQINEHHVRVTDGVAGYPCITIHQQTFVRWLYELGFQPSSIGKVIPPAVMGAPAFVREAVLRGLFSADGCTKTHSSGYRTATIMAVDENLRQSILRCMWSVGVAGQVVGSAARKYAADIVVQDVPAFVERIGYLQDYKNEGLHRNARHVGIWDKVCAPTASAITRHLRDSDRWSGLPEAVKNVTHNILRKRKGGRCRRSVLIDGLKHIGAPVPESLRYHHVAVDVVDVEPVGEVAMCDVEVFDDDHVFLANHMAVHNTQGSAIKGVINIKGAIPDRQLRAFRRMWYTMVSGVQNAWKTPILNADEVQWHSMHSTNREMEFSQWMDWLTKLTCAVFGIDPVEINFIFGGGGGKGGAMFDRRPNQAEVVESKDKGLKPLAEHIADCMNHHIVWELEEDFEFAFTGLDAKAEQKDRDARASEVKSHKTVDQIRAEVDDPPMPNGLGEVILDPTWLQFASQKMGMGGEEEEEGGEPQLNHPGEGETEGEEPVEQGMRPEGEEAEEQATEQPQREALAASIALSTMAERLEKSYRSKLVDGDRQILEIEIPGDNISTVRSE